MPRTAHTSVPINPVIAQRWSPRSYDPTATLTAADLTAAFEAARWSPSANNSQPWRFIVGFRGDDTFETIVNNLAGWNGTWAPHASALVVTAALTKGPDGTPNPFGLFDLGQSVAYFTVQAQSEGLFVHQMAGANIEGLQAAFNLPSGFQVFHTFAVGSLGDADALPAELAERERAPRVRHELSEIVHYGPYSD